MAYITLLTNCKFLSKKEADSNEKHIYFPKNNLNIYINNIDDGFYLVDTYDTQFINPFIYKSFIQDLMSRIGYIDREDILIKTRKRKIYNIANDRKKKKIFSEFLIPYEEVNEHIYDNSICDKIYKDFQKGYALIKNNEDSNFIHVYKLVMELFRKGSMENNYLRITY